MKSSRFDTHMRDALGFISAAALVGVTDAVLVAQRVVVRENPIEFFICFLGGIFAGIGIGMALSAIRTHYQER